MTEEEHTELSQIIAKEILSARNVAKLEQTALLIGVIKDFYKEKKELKNVDYITEHEMDTFLSEILKLTKDNVNE